MAAIAELPPVNRRDNDWHQVLLGLLPFLVIGTAIILLNLPIAVNGIPWTPVGGFILLAGELGILIGLLFGWLAGFPRWVFPYLVYSFTSALFLANASTPGVEIFGIYLFGSELWGWRAFVPLGIVVLLALAISRGSGSSLVSLAKGAWHDWTMLSFGMYGLMPLAVMVGMDEVDHGFKFPWILAAIGITSLGAFLYMRLNSAPWRLVALLSCAALSAFMICAAADYYWQTNLVNLSTGDRQALTTPADVSRLLNRGFIGVALVWTGLLLPLAVGIIHWLWQKFSKSRSH